MSAFEGRMVYYLELADSVGDDCPRPGDYIQCGEVSGLIKGYWRDERGQIWCDIADADGTLHSVSCAHYTAEEVTRQ